MEANAQHDSIILVGRISEAAILLHIEPHAHPTLVGYIEQTSRELLTVAAQEKREHGEIHPAFRNLLFEVRDAYNDALLAADGDEDGTGEDGDETLFSEFKDVLDEKPQRERKGRPFSKIRPGDVRMGETTRGGNSKFARKR